MKPENRKRTLRRPIKPLILPKGVVFATVASDELASLRVHPFANAFSMESPANTKLLAEDLKGNGQQHPVVVCGNVLIDGRNRLKAAQIEGLQVRVKYIPKMSEAKIRSLILSLNVKRTERPVSERARLALEYYDDSKASGNPATLQGAANMYNVAKRTIDRLIERRNAKDKPKELVRRIVMSDISKKHHIMVEALSKMHLFKMYGKGCLCQYKKFESRILELATEILEQGEMRGEHRTFEMLERQLEEDEDK